MNIETKIKIIETINEQSKAIVVAINNGEIDNIELQLQLLIRKVSHIMAVDTLNKFEIGGIQSDVHNHKGVEYVFRTPAPGYMPVQHKPSTEEENAEFNTRYASLLNDLKKSLE